MTSASTVWECANNPILAQLEEAFDNTDTFIYPIGDSVRARRIMEGTMEGRAIPERAGSERILELAPLGRELNIAFERF